MRLTFKQQAAIDSGGILRQFFTKIFEGFIDGNSEFCLFEGLPNHLVPIQNSDTCLSEIFVYVGKVISHSISQGGPGFPYLAKSCFDYLATSSIKQAAYDASKDDVPHTGVRAYIEQVGSAFKSIQCIFYKYLQFAMSNVCKRKKLLTVCFAL